MEKENGGIKGSTIIKIIIILAILMAFILGWKILSDKQEAKREEIYAFYITDENQNLLMEGGIDTAELVTEEKDGETVYRVKVNFTDDAAVIFENITELNLNRSIQLYLDNEMILSSPINEVIANGQIYIPANDEEHGKELAFKLKNTEV